MATLAYVNLEEGMPTISEAMSLLQGQIRRYSLTKNVCLVVIHGYGSSGKGGAIGIKTRQWLAAQKRNGKIKNLVFGEDFSIFDATSRNLKVKYPGLSAEIERGNHGITIVEL